MELKTSRLIASLPSLVKLIRLAGIILVLAGIAIIIAYNRSWKRTEGSPVCGRLGTLPFQVLVVAVSLIASIGSLLKVQ
ncbi:MAG: hypothetical protein WCR02_07715 [Sphaerochaetaceae bacterium]